MYKKMHDKKQTIGKITKEHFEGLVKLEEIVRGYCEGVARLAAEVFFQGPIYESYIQGVSDILQRNHNLRTYKIRTCEEEDALITENALNLLKHQDPNFGMCAERDPQIRNDISEYFVDLVEVRKKYHELGIDVLLDGIVPIIGTRAELELIRKSGTDDLYQALNDLINNSEQSMDSYY